jgi:hypothetical protein
MKRLKPQQPPNDCQAGATDLRRGASAIEGSNHRTAGKTRATAEGWDKKRHFYKPLAKQFRRDGFIYRQIAREGDAAIYEQTWSGCSNPSVSYEVIRVRRRDGFEISGRFVEPAEVYPGSELWGADGFNFTDKDAAFARLQQLAFATGEVGV